MYGLVYLATNTINGKLYVGVTTSCMKARWQAHINEAKLKARWILHKAIVKYGADAFTISLLELCDNANCLNEAEIRWIAELRSNVRARGYNMTIGGGGTSGHRMTAESRDRMSAAQKGRTFTAEARAKMSASRMGMQQSAEQRAARSATMRAKGPHPGALAALKLAHEARRGKKMPRDQVERMRARKLGVPLSAAARMAISRPVEIHGIRYGSVLEAANALSVSYHTVARRLSKQLPGYVSIAPKRTRAKRTEAQIEAMRISSSRPVKIGDIEYASLTSAAKALNLTRPGVAYRIKVGTAGRPSRAV